MERKNGWIDVDKMLQDIGVDITNINKIKQSPLITCHYHIGTDILIEFKYDSEFYLFKYKSSSIPYNELIAYELANDF